MASRVDRRTVDLSSYPELMVIYLGMRVNTLTGIKTLVGFGPRIAQWARSTPHRDWWREFLRDSGGTGFWHETYFMRGGMESLYDDMVAATGFLKFAPVKPARGGMFTARDRAHRPGAAATPPPLSEDEVYR